MAEADGRHAGLSSAAAPIRVPRLGARRTAAWLAIALLVFAYYLGLATQFAYEPWPATSGGFVFNSQLRALLAGRLDIDSTGLLVLTQDGRIARQLIGAGSNVEKEYLVRVEGCAWSLETLRRGARERLPAILMTAVVTALAMLPLTIDSDNPGGEIMGPMAAIIVGGLFSSTFLNLLVMPALLLRFGRFDARGPTLAR